MKKISTGLDSEVKRVPYKNWDPIGVRDLPEADDVYNSYVSNISRMLIDGNTVEDIYDHLRWVESDRIGLDGDELHTRAAANQLIDLAKVYLVTCPCCNKLTLGSQGNYEICDVCGWEDDPVQSDDPTFAGGANRSSLNEARALWQARKIGRNNNKPSL